MKTSAIGVSVVLLGITLLPATAAFHSTVDCSASGAGDESCSSTNSCNYDQEIGVHAYTEDGTADTIHGEFTCSEADARCTENDASCFKESGNVAGSSGVGNCSGYVEENWDSWNTFKLECFIVSSSSSSSSPSPSVLPDPLSLTRSSPAFTGWALQAHSTGDVVGSYCEDGICEPVPAECSLLGSQLHCWIV